MNHSDMPFTLPPFPGFPSANRFVNLGPVMDAVTRVSRSVLAREAISLVIGPPGTGKSLLCALLVKEFIQDRDVVSVGETTITDEASFYRFLLNRLGVAIDNYERSELEWMVDQHLSGLDANPNGMVLIIDEAADLTIEVLEAVRRMTNMMRDGVPMVSAVVVGGNKLDETLTSPKMESFVQRIGSRCYLHPLSAAETRDYIRRSIEVCEASPDDTITDSAIAAIHHAASGVPRLINQLMTEAIDRAADLGESLIGDHTVDRAWATLQQLPGPMIEEPELKAQTTAVEFGDLAPSEDDELLIGLTESANDTACEDTVSEDAIEPTSAEAEIEAPEMLFGDFDEEESVDVGSPMMVAKIDTKPLDLESILHSEIVALSHFANENTNLIGDGQPLVAEPMMIEQDVLESETPLAELDTSESNPAESNPAALKTADDGLDADNAVKPRSEFPSVVWYDEPAEQPETAVDDDSDLLWITEDIDVEGREIRSTPEIKPHRIDSAETDGDAPKLTLDYRELLEKMREQS